MSSDLLVDDNLFDIICDCEQYIVKSYSDGNTKIRSKVTILTKSGKVLAVCRQCGREHELPIEIKIKIQPKIRHYIKT